METANIKWSDRPWFLKDFPSATQTRIKQIEPNRPVKIDIVGGGILYIRRVSLNRFQCGIEGSGFTLPVAS